MESSWRFSTKKGIPFERLEEDKHIVHIGSEVPPGGIFGNGVQQRRDYPT